jgi:hypothetical protein
LVSGLKRTLWAGLSGNDNSLDVGIVGGIVRCQHGGSAEEDVDGLQAGLPVLGGFASHAESSAVHEGTEELPSSKVDGDVQHLGDANARLHPELSGLDREQINNVSMSNIDTLGNASGA